MKYDADIRQAKPDEDDSQITKIEIEFAIPSFITMDQQQQIADLIEAIARSPKNTPVNGVHWQSGCGSKPQWSQADALFLGKRADPTAPEKGEPSYDDEVLYFETSAREDF